MLDLYHHGSSVCAAKVRWAMILKDLKLDRKSVVQGKSVDLGGRRIIKKKKKMKKMKSTLLVNK